MPEIPFVETVLGALAPRLRGRRVLGVTVLSPSVLKSVDPPLGAVSGSVIESVSRRGKLLLFDLSPELMLIVHLKRDGRLALAPARQRPTRDVALMLRLDADEDLRLLEIGPKKRAGVYLRRAGEVDSTEPLAGLGRDALRDPAPPEQLGEMLKRARMHLKRFLGTQRYLAGIGNAFSDEILWEARLSPFLASDRVRPPEIVRLAAAIPEVLGRAVAEHRAHFGDRVPMREPVALLRVHRRGGDPCPRCGTPIAAVHYADRETYYCPNCQTGGKVYADRRLSRLLK